jgi:cytochrome P450
MTCCSIPKGSVVIAFTWALARNPELFPDFDTLRPERYLDPETGRLNNMPVFSFGYGRRICVGMK